MDRRKETLEEGLQRMGFKPGKLRVHGDGTFTREWSCTLGVTKPIPKRKRGKRTPEKLKAPLP